MSKYNVGIVQKRIGYVEIDANTDKEAISIATKLYIEESRELPEMEDCEPLICFATPKVCKYFVGLGECSCNNDVDDYGDCIYENGYKSGKVQMECKWYEE